MSNMNKHKNNSKVVMGSGFSLVEVLLSIALFALLTVGLLAGILTGQESSVLAGHRMRATLLAQGGLEIMRNIKTSDFVRLSERSDGVYYLEHSTDAWTLDGVEPEKFGLNDFFEREIELEEISSDVVEVTSRIRWQQNHRRTGMVELVTRFANWLESLWMQTTEQEFLSGFENSVAIENTAGGEVALDYEGTWIEPSLVYAWNMSGSHDARAIARYENDLWVARATDPGSPELYRVALSDIDTVGDTNTPVIEESFEINYTATGLVVEPDAERAYVSTNTNSADAVLVNFADTNLNTILDLEGNAMATDIIKTDDSKVIVSMRNNSGGAEVHVRSSSLSGTHGKVEIGDHANALALYDDYVYVATGDSAAELWIVDYNDCLGALENYLCTSVAFDVPESSGELTALEVVGDTLYVGRSNGYVHALDLSDPLDPDPGFWVDTGNSEVTGIAPDPENELLLVSTDGASTREVLVVNMQNGDVVEIDLVGAQTADAIIRYGNVAYVASREDEEIQILRGGMGGWQSPQYSDAYDISSNVNGRAIFWHDDKAFVATNRILSVFDVSDPEDIKPLDDIDVGANINKIAADDSYVYLATAHNDQELLIVDIQDPSSISLVPGGIFDAESKVDAMAIWVDGSRVYLGTRKNGGNPPGCAGNTEFYIIDVSNPRAPSCLGTYKVDQQINDIHVSGGYAYLATNNNSNDIIIVDVSNPLLPSLAYSQNTSGNANDVFVLNDNLYVGLDDATSADDLIILDIADPENPRPHVSYDTGDRLDGIVSDGSLVFTVSNINESFRVFDISQAPTVTPTGSYDTAGACLGVAWSGALAHLACSSNVEEYLVLGPQDMPSDRATEGWFTSEAFDSGSSNTRWSGIAWSSSGVGSVGMQMRTAPDAGGTPGSWSQWLGVGGQSTLYTDGSGASSVYSAHRDGSGDQWVQYRALLQGESNDTPVLEDVTIQF